MSIYRHCRTQLFLLLSGFSSFWTASVLASSGCGVTSLSWKFTSDGHSNQTVGGRAFWVHLPTDYDSNTAAPLVLSYHGYGVSQTTQEMISGFSDPGLVINGTGIVAVYPLGAYGPGQPGDGPSPAWQGSPVAAPGVDDVAFTQNMISALQDNLCIDPNRIFVSGKSEGGAFTNLLACSSSTSDMIAAYAPVSAALYNGTLPFAGCEQSNAVPLINFHGLSDTIVPFDGRSQLNGNTSYALPNITVWRSAVAGRNSCNSTQTLNATVLDSMSSTEDSWNCASENSRAVVNGYSVQGLGHSWPSTLGLDGQQTSFNATSQYIIPFFEAHPNSFSFDYSIAGNSSGSGTSGAEHGVKADYMLPLVVSIGLCLLL